MDSITVEFSTVPTSPSLYDAISYNYTFYMYPGNYTPELLDKNSPAFKETAYKFCKDIDKIFESLGLRAVRKRYYGCVVDEFGPNREVNFRVALTDTDVVRPSSMFNIFAYHGDQVNLNGVYHLPMGGVYVAVDMEPTSSLFKLESFTTHPYPFVTTTPTVLYTVITVSLQVLEPGWTSDLEDHASARYRLLSEPFCNDVTAWVTEWKKDYIKCSNVNFSKDPFTITAELSFTGLQGPNLDQEIYTILMERANRIFIDNMYALDIGDMLIYDQSLVLSKRTVSVDETTPVSVTTTDGTTVQTKPTTTAELDPCLYSANLDYVPHPTKCDQFYQCINGMAFPITCKPGSIFDGGTCIAAPPGFVCRR
ncbi:unnamed protein product [Lymnaea stagnalis]|uniref:Chitin-binding type-2 domain-containing protein n=1 Tax=Lymnaea stagnalis TaxID=6523 RepID=A0AAV2I1E4_LYMST